MEWSTIHHLDLRHVGWEGKPLQPHAAAFHPNQALIVVAVGKYIIEFDAINGSKISTVDMDSPVVRMSYSPTGVHAVVAILEDCTLRLCDFDAEQSFVLHSPERKMERLSFDMEVHLALTPLQAVAFYGFHRKMSVTVVGTVEGGRVPTKIRTDLKKPVVNISCHPRLPVLYVAYAEGFIRAYSIHSYAVLYTLQLDSTIKLLGAGSFAFHPTLEWVFVGDRRGTLLAWDVSSERPYLVGITQVGSQPITSVSWLPMFRLLTTLTKGGVLQLWKTRAGQNPYHPSTQANFFEQAAIESIDIPQILSQKGGEETYPLPHVQALEVHPKLNMAALLFANMTSVDNLQNRAALAREGRKQLFAVLQNARGSSASILKEKLAALGSTGILADHQLQAQLQERHLKGLNQLSIADIARKAFLHSHFLEGHAKSAPISRLPLITILDTRNRLRDLPICQPLHMELHFFNKQNRSLHYPTRAFYIEGENLMAYNLCSGVGSIYKKLYSLVPAHAEFCPRNIVYSRKQHLFLVTYEFIGVVSEVVLYQENTDSQLSDAKSSTIKGREAAFIGPGEKHFAILEEDKIGLLLYILPGSNPKELDEKNAAALENPTAYMENPTADYAAATGGVAVKGPIQFMFEADVDRIFSTPLDSTLMFASNGSQISFAKLVQGYHLSGDGHYIPTTSEGRKSIKLKVDEIVLQVQWQETLRGFVAGVLTTHRVLIASASLKILASSSTKFDKGMPPFRSLLWAGPALLFSSATAISVLGWDGKVRSVLSISTPHADALKGDTIARSLITDARCLRNLIKLNTHYSVGSGDWLVKKCEELLLVAHVHAIYLSRCENAGAVLLGALNDRLLFASPTQVQPRQKKGIEVKSCLVGLLEPLLIGYATMQQYFEQKLDLPETLYQITSRFDSLRITPRSLDILAQGSPVCGDLAVALSQAGPQFTQVERGIYAIKALCFSTALTSLKDRFMRSRDYPHCPPTSLLFHLFRHLGFACIKYGQFDSAKETFQVVADYESMVDLFICHLNPSAIRQLAQTLEQKDGSSLELRRYCERILGVRSTGWTQGIFANFAAESMVPKGPEWGGANWKIDTHTNMKDIPQWALAADVMPYMRTDDGPIPAIVADHIGIHLGCIKGRGNVVQVREDSLIKAFKTANSDTITTGAPMFSAHVMEDKPDGVFPHADYKADSLMGLKMHTHSTAPSSAAVDQQAKAEEDFKKSLYGDATGDSSSDEEGVPKTKKFQIRIRDKPASPSVDVNKIKEAARQFSLGPTVGRTKSLTELQDAALVYPQTTQTRINPSVSSDNLFSLGPLAKPPSFSPPPLAKGSAVTTAAPIPEDFFQNTISSVQIAAALPPPGAVISRLDPQLVGNKHERPSQASSPADVPAQATHRPSVQVDSVGLPDGGVKPDDHVKPTPVQTSPAQSLPRQTSAQPMDLGLLQPSVATHPGKPAIQKSQVAPVSVRPGQVPHGAPASICFKTGLVHLEHNQLPDALSCFNEGFLALAKDLSRGSDIKAQATICAQYKIAVALLQEIRRLQQVSGAGAVSAKDEMARLSRHLGSLPLLAKHRMSCIRTAIQHNMKVQNYAYSKQLLDLLLSKAPPTKRDELQSLIDLCVQRGLTNKSMKLGEDPSQFCAATLGHLSTIGYDMCDLCDAKFSALAAPGCVICGMGGIKRSDALAGKGPAPCPFG